jgi:hypothetical protein
MLPISQPNLATDLLPLRLVQSFLQLTVLLCYPLTQVCQKHFLFLLQPQFLLKLFLLLYAPTHLLLLLLLFQFFKCSLLNLLPLDLPGVIKELQHLLLLLHLLSKLLQLVFHLIHLISILDLLVLINLIVNLILYQPLLLLFLNKLNLQLSLLLNQHLTLSDHLDFVQETHQCFLLIFLLLQYLIPTCLNLLLNLFLVLMFYPLLQPPFYLLLFLKQVFKLLLVVLNLSNLDLLIPQ